MRRVVTWSPYRDHVITATELLIECFVKVYFVLCCLLAVFFESGLLVPTAIDFIAT